MTIDTSMKIKDLGEVNGSFLKSTATNVYLKDAHITNSNGVVIALLKIEKKYILSVRRVGLPNFESFSDEQLHKVIEMNNAEYTAMCQKILAERQPAPPKVEPETIKEPEVTKKQPKEKKESKQYDQFEVNKKLYGVKPEFDMSEYADVIDKNAPGYKERKEMLHKMAREISSHNRGETVGGEKDTRRSEDQLFSSVQSTSRWEKVPTRTATESAVESKKPLAEASKRTADDAKKTADPEKPKPGKSVETVPTVDKAKEIQTESARAHAEFNEKGWASMISIMKSRSDKTKAAEKTQQTQEKPVVAPSSSPVKSKTISYAHKAPVNVKPTGDLPKYQKKKAQNKRNNDRYAVNNQKNSKSGSFYKSKQATGVFTKITTPESINAMRAKIIPAKSKIWQGEDFLIDKVYQTHLKELNGKEPFDKNESISTLKNSNTNQLHKNK